MSSTPTRCGYVTLLGVPNVGKSSLLNRLVGEPLSIVTAKAQTTWKRVTGLRTTDTHQMIFLDTPGILRAEGPFQRSLAGAALDAVREADVLLVLADPTRPLDPSGRALLEETASKSGGARIGIVTKSDLARDEAMGAEAEWLQSAVLAGDSVVVPVSARTGEGVDGLLREIETRLPPGPFLYPADDVATEPVRYFAAEFVREAIFELYEDEVPYACFSEVEEFREEGEKAYVKVVVHVERESQKGILIGKDGRAIRETGTRARRRLEHFLGRPVYLDLWIKVLPGWRRKAGQLRRLGFVVPEE